MLVNISGNVRPFIAQQVGRHQWFTSGTVRFRLVAPSRSSNVPKHKVTGHVSPVHVDVPVRFDGSFSAQVERNDEITPAGTVYSVMILAPNINLPPMFYAFNGPGPFNLNAVAPTSDPESRGHHAQELREKIARLQEQLKAVEG